MKFAGAIRLGFGLGEVEELRRLRIHEQMRLYMIVVNTMSVSGENYSPPD